MGSSGFQRTGAFALLLAGVAAAHADDAVSTLGAPGCRLVDRHPRAGQSAVWSGACRDGMADGEGVVTLFIAGQPEMTVAGRLQAGLPVGRIVIDSTSFHIHYEGELLDEHYEGPGVLVQADGVRVTARFSHGEPDGDVDAVQPDGGHYHGPWRGQRAQGQGEAVLADSTRYLGGFRDGVPDGAGELTRGGVRVRGVWSAGHQAGAMVMDAPGPVHYEGQARDLQPEGEGTMTYADGLTYRGAWVAGRREGEGTLTAADGRLLYAGGFRADLADGQGRMLYEDGSCYEGALSHGLRQGHGRMSGRSGVMEGEFSEAAQEFRGALVDPAGNRSEGRWVNGRYEGEVLIETPGRVQRVTFNDGVLEGPADIREADGSHVVAGYHAGLLDGPYRIDRADGSVARGEYRAGVQEGTWENESADGRILRQEFLHGQDVTPPASVPEKPPTLPPGSLLG